MNKRDIQKILSESSFNPKEEGLFKAILDSGDAAYFQHRAAEFIRESQASTKPSDKHRCLIMAIKLLVAARATISNPVEGKTVCNRKIKGGNCILPKGHEGAHQHGQADNQEQVRAGSQDSSGTNFLPDPSRVVREGDPR